MYKQLKYAFFTEFLKDDYQAFSHLKTFLGKNLPEIEECVPPDRSKYNCLINECFEQFLNNETIDREAVQQTTDQDVIQKVTELLTLETSPDDRQDIAHTIKLLGIHLYRKEITTAMWKQQYKEREAMNEIIPGLYNLPKATTDSGMTLLGNITNHLKQFLIKREKVREYPDMRLLTEKKQNFLKDRLKKLKDEQMQFEKNLEHWAK